MTLTGQVRPDDPGEPTTGLPRVSIAADEIDILAGLARGKNVLEIGSGFGVSTSAMARKAWSVWTVDPDPVAQEAIGVLASVKSCVRSCASVSEVVGASFDMAFIDGDHNDTAVARDIADCVCRLKPGGLLVLHDALSGNVRQGCKLAGITVLVLPTTYGLGLWIKP